MFCFIFKKKKKKGILLWIIHDPAPRICTEKNVCIKKREGSTSDKAKGGIHAMRKKEKKRGETNK